MPLKEKDKRKMSTGSQGNSSFLFFLNSSVAGVHLRSYLSIETSAAVLLRGKICFKFGSFDARALWGHLAENSLILDGKSNGTRAWCTLLILWVLFCLSHNIRIRTQSPCAFNLPMKTGVSKSFVAPDFLQSFLEFMCQPAMLVLHM